MVWDHTVAVRLGRPFCARPFLGAAVRHGLDPHGLHHNRSLPTHGRGARPVLASRKQGTQPLDEETSMSAPAQPRAGFGKVVGASVIGTTVEWYDFFLYGSAAA